MLQLESAVELELGAAIKVYGLLLNKSALRIMLLKKSATCCDQTTSHDKTNSEKINGALDMEKTPA